VHALANLTFQHVLDVGHLADLVTANLITHDVQVCDVRDDLRAAGILRNAVGVALTLAPVLSRAGRRLGRGSVAQPVAARVHVDQAGGEDDQGGVELLYVE
jgi:hypothetical protein